MSAAISMSTEPLTRSQKAAAVLVAVGPDVAAEVVRRLSEVEVEQLALEIATLGQLPAEQLDMLLVEFRDEAIAHGHLVAGGEHHAREILRRIHGVEGDALVDRLLATVQTAPFHFLRLHEPAEVIQHLTDEHPQTVALVLAHLPTRFASQLLAGFEPDLQADIARRIALLDRTSPDVVASVESALQARFGTVQRRQSRTGRGGVKELADLLNQSDRSTERAILTELEATDPELAESVRGLMFVFEDIATLDDRTIQTILRSVEMKQLALAVKGLAPALLETITRNLSERARLTLEEEVELLGPVRVKDVEAAQTDIVREIRRLEDAGEIAISRGEGEFVA